MSAMASQIPAARLFAQSFVQAQIKENLKAQLAFLRRIRWSPVDSLHKGRVTGKNFLLMTSSMSVNISPELDQSWNAKSSPAIAELTKSVNTNYKVRDCNFWKSINARPCRPNNKKTVVYKSVWNFEIFQPIAAYVIAYWGEYCTHIGNIVQWTFLLGMICVLIHDDVIKWKKKIRVTGHLCGNSPVTGEFPTQKPATRSFNVFLSVPE